MSGREARWTLVTVQQLSAAFIRLGVREVVERRPGEVEGEPAARKAAPAHRDTIGVPSFVATAELVTLTTALIALIMSVGSLAAMVWWLATGRGPGGRIVAASAVTPRHYRIARPFRLGVRREATDVVP